MSRGTKLRQVAVVALAMSLTASVGASAWLIAGHRRLARAAVDLLPESLPVFFREGGEAIASGAAEPDIWRNVAAPTLFDREAPEHFLNLELLGDSELPALRSGYLALLSRLQLDARTTGYLPYAVLEGLERLTICFATHRARPGSGVIRAQCLLYAGWLAHYVGDLVQPLHTTIHHDGRALANGESPSSGLHRLLEEAFDGQRDPLPQAEPQAETPAEILPLADPRQAVLAELAASHDLVDATYALGPILRLPEGGQDPRVVAYSGARLATGTRLLARIYLTAWERSAAVEIPPTMLD